MVVCNTVYAEIFVGEIFCGVKFSWLMPPTKIGRHHMEKSEDICYISHFLSDNFSEMYVFNAPFLILFSLQTLFCGCVLEI